MTFNPFKTILLYHRRYYKVPGKYYEYRNNRPGHNPQDNHLYLVGKHARPMQRERIELSRNRGNKFFLNIWLKINRKFQFFDYAVFKNKSNPRKRRRL